jgi:hypothetical protein
MQSETINDLSAALAKAQAVMKSAPFDRTNPHFKNKYATLASVIDTIRTPLAEAGLSYTQTTELRDNGFVLVTTLRHASGQWVQSEYPLPMGVRPQELGSALTYARRYSLSALVCIAADDDDDAEGARIKGHTSSEPRPNPHTTQPSDIVPTPEYDEHGEPKARGSQLRLGRDLGGLRLNPHTTQPSDIVPTPEYDEHGEPVDNIPNGDDRIEPLPKAKARTHYALLQSALRMAKTPDELTKWAREHANQVASLPSDWRETLRGQFTEHMTDLRAAQEAAQ